MTDGVPGGHSLVAKVLTVSDSVAAGEAEDRSGPVAVACLEAAGFEVLCTWVVPDGADEVARALEEMLEGFVGLVVTTGGTGFAPRDLTPEATKRVLDREAPGIAEAMRGVNPLGRLSRGLAGIAGRSVVINLPGSPGGVEESLGAVLDVLPHALRLAAGESVHERSAHERSAHERSAHERSAHERSGHERSGHERSGHERSGHERRTDGSS